MGLIDKIKDKYGCFDEKNNGHSLWKSLLLLCVVLIITMWIEKTCLKTLLPICIPWMYYQFILMVLYVLLDPICNYFGGSKTRVKKGKDNSYAFSFKCVLALIIIPAIIFLPNRYISTESESENLGGVVDKTTWAMTRTASWDNYVKVKLDGENTSFWYDLRKENKPLGSKCIVSVRRGIFGMRFVENVDFLVE